jgi:minor extracellular serine protease Vpr
MEAPSLAQSVTAAARTGRALTSSEERSRTAAARASQASALRQAKALGGEVVFRYSRLVNAFSARLSVKAAAALSARSDVASVQPVSIIKKTNETSVPFIGAPEVWRDLGVRGQGMRVAVVDTGVDYTHADFGGPGTLEAYNQNDPTVIESGTFPTSKVIGGFDFVGEDYDVLDEDTTNDTPRPDFDPLDFDGHGTHVGGTCCGNGVPGQVGKGVAPRSKIYAFRVWDVGNSTDDVLVAAYERAVDPNQDGSTSDAVDVLQFSGGVTFGTLNSVEARAAQRVVDLGTVFVASQGNDGNQPAGGSAYTGGTPASARGVVAVAASIDQFVAQLLTVNEPAGTELPDGGIMVHQDWSGDLPPGGLTGDLMDAREVDPPAAANGDPVPSDAQLCAPVAGTPFAGTIALVFKGSTGEGDCDGSTKVLNAQEAGAIGVVLWSGFAGPPFALGAGADADAITIPAVMVSGNDGAALGALLSPDAPNAYNTQTVNVTLNAEGTIIPGFEDRLTDFSSEGPARLTNDLKPDISAPGSDITSAGAGTGDGSSVLSGTSMAAPHVSGVATLLRQIHPSWSPARIKALMMNQAKRALTDVNGEGPISAAVQGAGRVRADQSAKADSVATPGSLSFNLRFLTEPKSFVRRFTVRNTDDRSHSYTVSAGTRYSDFGASVATPMISSGGAFGASQSFTLGADRARRLRLRLTLDPSDISEVEQEFGWYFFHPNIDGFVNITQSGGRNDTLGVPWHVVVQASSANDTDAETLELSPSDSMSVTNTGTGRSYADFYLLGDEDEVNSFGEEDVTHTGARSFTGATIDGVPEAAPPGPDPLGELSWIDFLTNDNAPDEPIEFGVVTKGQRDTTESQEIDVLIDAGADGDFADPELQADFMAVKTSGVGTGGTVCLFDLSLADPFAECVETYFADYSNYNNNVTGVVVDAQAIGLTDASPELAYQVIACTGTYSGDVPTQVCDTAGAIDEDTGTYTARLNTTDPALVVDPLVCGGFWQPEGPECTEPGSVEVSRGSAADDEDPSLLAIFPNNPPDSSAKVITTTHEPAG